MTKDDWLTFENALTRPYGSIQLMADGYRVSFSVSQHQMRLVILTYVNGFFKGKWLVNDCEERRRFYRPKTVSIFSPTEQKNLTKGLSKSYVKKHLSGLEKKATYYHFEWLSVSALKRHLIANNKSIQLHADPAVEALNAKAADLGILL